MEDEINVKRDVLLIITWGAIVLWSVFTIGKWFILEVTIPADVKLATVLLFVAWLIYKVGKL